MGNLRNHERMFCFKHLKLDVHECQTELTLGLLLLIHIPEQVSGVYIRFHCLV